MLNSYQHEEPHEREKMQQLIECLPALSRFLSPAGGKAFLFFIALKKKDKFEWITECDEAFTNVNIFLTSPLSSFTRRKTRLCSSISRLQSMGWVKSSSNKYTAQIDLCI